MSNTVAAPSIGVAILPEGIPVGWKLLTGESVLDPNGPVRIELHPVLKGGEGYVGGEEMLDTEKMLDEQENAGTRAGLGAARAFLYQQNLIPPTWRNKKLLFTGAVVLDSNLGRRVASLTWNGSWWRLGWDLLNYFFCSDYRAVRCYPK